ncbi:MAG: Hsp20/alpha crystallin family protein, partial [Ilumatobacteraceae bacterium]
MRRLLALLVAALALTACKIDATVAVVVEPDGSGTIALTIVADADVVTQAPGLAEDLRFDDAVAAGWVLDGPTATEAGGLTVTLTHSFATVEEATVLLQSVNGSGGPLHDAALARLVEGDTVTTSLTGNIRVEGGMDAFADPDVLAAIGGSPYADDIAATGQRPADVVTFTMTADLPGVAKEDVAIAVADGVLTITANRKPAVPEGFTSRYTERRALAIE